MSYTSTDPFTNELVRTAEIDSNDVILDLGCGTGKLTMKILNYLSIYNKSFQGKIFGIDISYRSLVKAASKFYPNVNNIFFINMSVDHLGFQKVYFNKVICQFGLMFFQDPLIALKSVRELMKHDGKFVVSVHGESKCVPYFSIMSEILFNYIPTLDKNHNLKINSFGNYSKLYNLIRNAGFSNIKINNFTYPIRIDSFETYWLKFFSYSGKSFKNYIESLDEHTLNSIKKEVKENTKKYTNGSGCIIFPWSILIASAYNKP